MEQYKPKSVIILSGKRKSGKDYIAELIRKKLDEDPSVIHISEPIKKIFSEMNKTNFEEMMSSSEYKETYREHMVKWSENEKIKRNDQYYFLRLALEKANQKIWIIVDARRMCDLHFFESEEYKDTKIIKVRIQASNVKRKERGWTYTSGIDDATTECGLDGYENWDYIITNDGDQIKLSLDIDDIVKAAL